MVRVVASSDRVGIWAVLFAAGVNSGPAAVTGRVPGLVKALSARRGVVPVKVVAPAPLKVRPVVVVPRVTAPTVSVRPVLTLHVCDPTKATASGAVTVRFWVAAERSNP